MELSGEVLMNAPRERVWLALNDAAVLQACIPGCEEVVEESATERRARVMVKIGPVRARFQGRVSLSDVVAPERCTLAFEGSGGAAGMASGKSQLQLLEDGAATRLSYTVKASVGGKLGQIGGRMVDASAKQLADQFFNALRVHLEPAAAPATSEVPDMPADKPAAPGTPTMPATLAAPAQATAVRAAAAAAPAIPLPSPAPTPLAAEASRVLWFLLGAASTGFGVWLGARLL